MSMPQIPLNKHATNPTESALIRTAWILMLLIPPNENITDPNEGTCQKFQEHATDPFLPAALESRIYVG
jgi:hypothetical protein